MAVEIAAPEAPESMTSLDLFVFSPERRGQIRQDQDNLQRVALDISRSRSQTTNLVDLVASKRDHIDQRHEELAEEFRNITTTILVSEYYLRLNDDMSALGASDDEIMDVLKRSLNANIRMTSEIYHRDNMSPTHKGRIFEKYFKQSIQGMRIPHWFRGNRRQWEEYFMRPRTHLQSYLSRVDYPLIFKPGLPDWMEINPDGKPPKEAVEEEMKQSLLEKVDNLQKWEKLKEQSAYLRTWGIEKLAKIKAWESSRLKDGAKIARTFPGVILALGQQQDLVDPAQREAAIANIERKSGRKFAELLRDPVYSTAWLYASSTESTLNVENVALWLESSVVSVDVSEGLEDPVNAGFINFLKSAFEEPNENRPTAEELALFPNPTTPNYKVLNDFLRPMLSSLPDEDKAFALDLLDESDGKLQSEVIWSLAQLVHSNRELLIQAKTDGKGSHFNKDLRHLAGFTIDWLRISWPWAYHALQERLAEVDEGTPPDSNPYLSSPGDDIGQEIEQDIDNLKLDVLDGWRIFYTDHPHSADEKYRTEIVPNGTGVDGAIDRFIRINSIPITVKTTSIANVLRDVVEMPPEIQERMEKYRIGDVDYYKKNRNNMRLFYLIDQETRQLVMYLLKKEGVDNDYRKLYRGRFRDQ